MTRTGWTNKKLNQLGFVGRGKSKHRPRDEASLYNGIYPFFQTGDVKAANLYLTEYTQTYNEKGLAQSKLWPVETLCITIAANIAETAILGIEACFPDSIVGFIADPKESNVYFVKYYIDTIKLNIQNISKGTTQDNLSLDKLLTFDFYVPSSDQQTKIAGMLLAYDDLIENNTQRIKALEQAAHDLYHEWFVNFRFPGHEQVEMVESALGLIPAGWTTTKIGNRANVQRGRSYKSTELADDGLPFLNLKCIDRDGGFRVGGLKGYRGIYKASQTAVAGDIVMAVTDMTQERRIVARAARVPDVRTPLFVFSMDLVKIEPSDDLPREYLYALLRYSRFPDEVKQYANGVNVLHLNPERIKNFQFDLPILDLVIKYADFCRSLYQEIDILTVIAS